MRLSQSISNGCGSVSPDSEQKGISMEREAILAQTKVALNDIDTVLVQGNGYGYTGTVNPESEM